MIHSATLFCLCLLLSTGVFGDTVKSISVMEGDTVTLNTDVKIQRDDLILWMFGPKETRLAEIHRQSIYIDVSDTIFDKRLQMDNQTGSLSIRNIRTEHSGLYKLTIISNRETSYKRFNLTVYAVLSVPGVTRDFSQCSSSERSSGPNCSLLCSVVNVSDVTLSWYKGNSLLSSISVSDFSISLSLPLEVEYQENNTYSCVINNPITNQTTHLNISQLCQTCPELKQQSHSVVLSVIVMVLILAVVVGAIYLHHSISKQARSQDLRIIEKQCMSENTQIIYCLQMEDPPQKSLLDVGTTETAVNYQHTRKLKRQNMT